MIQDTINSMSGQSASLLVSGLSVRLLIIPMTPPRNARISTTSMGVNPVNLRYSPPAEKGPVSGPFRVDEASERDGNVGFEGRNPARILASRACRMERRRECNSEEDGMSDGALWVVAGVQLKKKSQMLEIEPGWTTVILTCLVRVC